MNYVWTFLLALAGGMIGFKLKVPAGALIGALIAVGGVNALGLMAIPTFPPQVRFVLQVFLGLLLGTSVTKDTILAMRELWQPALICTSIMITTGVLLGFFVSRWLGIEQLTALLGSAPGGLSDMSLIALDMGAQGSTVVVMHLTRMISVVVVVPLVVRLIMRWAPPAG